MKLKLCSSSQYVLALDLHKVFFLFSYICEAHLAVFICYYGDGFLFLFPYHYLIADRFEILCRCWCIKSVATDVLYSDHKNDPPGKIDTLHVFPFSFQTGHYS